MKIDSCTMPFAFFTKATKENRLKDDEWNLIQPFTRKEYEKYMEIYMQVPKEFQEPWGIE